MGSRIRTVSRYCCISGSPVDGEGGVVGEVREVADDGERADQDDGRVRAHEARLKVAQQRADLAHPAPHPVDDAVNDARVEELPESLTRACLDRLDERRVVD